MTRRAFVAGTAALVACTGRQTPPPPTAEQRGAAWLWRHQDESGAFRSQVYGLLAHGDSLTPFCVQALMGHDHAGLNRAFVWMRENRTKDGALGFGHVAPDYPVYATSMMVSCFAAAQPVGHKEVVEQGIAWLRTQQYSEAWGDSKAVGGFGMGAQAPPQPPHVGHVDLSMTRRAVDAFVAAGITAEDPALQGARRFVEACRAPGGGFVYSPTEPVLNKGQAGYGSATTDGILALRALGVDVDNEITWLRKVHRVDRNPLADSGPYQGYGEAMRGYYRAGAAAVFGKAVGPKNWRGELIDAIVAEQAEDGSWRNESNLQKEDDPLIATALAIRALAAAREGA